MFWKTAVIPDFFGGFLLYDPCIFQLLTEYQISIVQDDKQLTIFASLTTFIVEDGVGRIWISE